MKNWLAVTALCAAAICPARAWAQAVPPPAAIAQGARTDPIKDGAARGALAGAGGMLALWAAASKSCGTGCERSGNSAAAAALVAVAGAGIGSLVGLAADLDAGEGEDIGLRAGPVFSATSFHSSLVDGRAAAPGVAAAVRLSPHLSVHIEYTATRGDFQPAPGTVPDDVVRNVVPATTRATGRLEWIERRRVSYVFTQLVGVHPRPWGRLRLEFRAGLGVQGQENHNYYEATVPGTYHVLDFKTPELGLVLGVDTEVAVARHVVVVPMIRFNQMGDPGPSWTYGVGVQWRGHGSPRSK